MDKEKKQSPLSASMEAYERLKREQETAEQRIQEAERTIRRNMGIIMTAQVDKEEAETEEDRQAYEDMIQYYTEENERMTREIEYLRDTLPQAMNTIIEEVSQNPDVKRMIDSRLDSEYKRKIDELTGKREKVVEEKNKAELVQNIINENPELVECMKRLLKAKRELPALKRMLEIESRLNESGDERTQNSDRRVSLEEKIRQTNEIIAQNRERIAISAGRAGVSFDNALEMLEGAEISENGSIDIVRQYDRQIQEYDSDIMFFGAARQNLANLLQAQSQPQPQQPQQTPQQQNPNQTVLQQNPIINNNLPADRNKKVGFFQRIKNWWERITGKDIVLERGPVQTSTGPQGSAQPQGNSTPTVNDPDLAGLDIIPEETGDSANIPQPIEPSAQQQVSQPSTNNDAINPLYSTPDNNGNKYAIRDRVTILKDDIFESELISDIYDDKKRKNEEATRENMNRISQINSEFDRPGFELDEPDFGDEGTPTDVEPSTSARADDTGSHDEEDPANRTNNNPNRDDEER